MVDVVAIGELLVDFYGTGHSEYGNAQFEACPGGAPCNVLAMLRKLGRTAAFIGKLGADMFGRGLKDTVERLGIDTSGILLDATVPTTLAFVGLDSHGERSFAFYRNPGADMMLRREEVDPTLVKSGRIFHFGTLSTTHPTVREATYASVSMAKEKGALISFDPNLRPLLWDSLDAAKIQMAWGCTQCDILKISDDEVQFLTGISDTRAASAALRRQYPDIKLITVTSGQQGSAAYYKDQYIHEPAFTSVNTIDTTGAGDTFCACMLHAVLSAGLNGFDEAKLRQALRFANAAAAIVTTRKGALRSMPDRTDIEGLLSARS